VPFGWQGSVTHDGLYEAASEPGPCRRWHLTHAVGAVTGAFLATRRQTFLDLGGFDEAALPIAYSDIDYALKLRASGSIVLWTPNITLYHHESKTRGLDHADSAKQARNAAERRVMEQRWGAALTLVDQVPGEYPDELLKGIGPVPRPRVWCPGADWLMIDPGGDIGL
jgi:O-antigen biosynthesis protein